MLTPQILQYFFFCPFFSSAENHHLGSRQCAGRRGIATTGLPQLDGGGAPPPPPGWPFANPWFLGKGKAGSWSWMESSPAGRRCIRCGPFLFWGNLPFVCLPAWLVMYFFFCFWRGKNGQKRVAKRLGRAGKLRVREMISCILGSFWGSFAVFIFFGIPGPSFSWSSDGSNCWIIFNPKTFLKTF